jgi:8-oxo-dGTP pyrophosphatase MutT (NUDIX family)
MVHRQAILVARAVLLSGEGPWSSRRLLAARHRRGDGSEFWCLPGGKADEGELVAEAAVREVREEAGIEIEVSGVVWVHDRPETGRFELVYSGRVLGPTPGPQPPPEDKHLVTVAWRPLGELAREDFQPRPLLEALLRGPLPEVPAAGETSTEPR